MPPAPIEPETSYGPIRWPEISVIEPATFCHEMRGKRGWDDLTPLLQRVPQRMDRSGPFRASYPGNQGSHDVEDPEKTTLRHVIDLGAGLRGNQLVLWSRFHHRHAKPLEPLL